MIKQIEHTALSVSDLDRSLEFYCDVMGLVLRRIIESPPEKGLGRINGLPESAARIAHLMSGTHMFELFEYSEPRGRKIGDRNQADQGFSHVGFASTDVVGDIARLRALGYLCLGEPVEYRPEVWVAYFSGPDNEVIELRQAPPGD